MTKFLISSFPRHTVSVSVGVMMRLEVDPTQGKSRVTVRAKNPIVTQAFKAFVVEALSV